MSDELEVLLYGNPLLRKKSDEVTNFDDDLRELVREMERAMRREDGIGLAAPQLGVHRRVLIAMPRRSKAPLAFVNPEFVEFGRQRDDFEEGCLSLPGITAPVERPVRVRVRYQDLEGNEHELEDDELLSRILQHEHDHLEGVLFVDHLSLLRRKLLAKKLKALSKRANEQRV